MNEVLINLQKYRNDPWEFAKDCVFTLDPKDAKKPIKKFPGDLEYLRLYFLVWKKERLVAVPKSRRMFMSWANLILYLWDAMFHEGRHVAFVSKKEIDADNLIDRCKFILDHIPDDKIPKKLIPKYNKTYTVLEFPEIHSKIQAFPSGADQLRMHGFSGVLNDEMAFQDDAKEMYAATFPTVEEHGRFTAISSPRKGFFKLLVHDEIEENPKITHVPSPMQGIELWRNGGNKFFIFQAHYSADPIKRDGGYAQAMRASMPIEQYRREFELIWDAFEGKCVYPDWNREIHGSKTRMDAQIGLPLLIGVDQGLQPAAVVCQLQEDTLVVLQEYMRENMGGERFAEYVRDQLRIDFPQWHDLKRDIIVGMDPTGFNRRDVDERTYAAAWAKLGFKPAPGENLWEKRRQSVERWLIKFRKGRPCFRVNIKQCPTLVSGFDGGYRYPDQAFEIEPVKIRPVKDVHSQPHDALQYILTLIEKKSGVKLKPIPSPVYSWSER